MAKEFVISLNDAVATLDTLVDAVDVGSVGASKVLIYDTKVANPETANGGQKLLEFDLQNPAYGDAAAGTKKATATLNGTPISATGLVAADALHGLITDRDGRVLGQGTVGTTDADIIISPSATIVVGEAYQLQSWDLEKPTGEP